MVKCPRCGYENSATSVYCTNCDYPLKDNDGKRTAMTKRDGSWKISTGKKIIIVLGIIIIALLLFSLMYNSSQPTRDERLNVITDNGSTPETSSYPYKAVIIYEGDWYSEMGDPNYLVQKSGHGTQSFKLDCASWDRISIEAHKEDSGLGDLKVQLLRNGKVVAENSTTNESGSAVINYNY